MSGHPETPSPRKMQELRKRRRADGWLETQIWVRRETLEKVTAAVEAGQFKTRREALLAAVEDFFDERMR